MIDILLQMGPLALPLMLCSILSLAIILDRGRVALRRRLPPRSRVDGAVAVARSGDGMAARNALADVAGPFGEGARKLLSDPELPRKLREDSIALWLDEYRRGLLANVRLLQLIAAISPLLGLLGTVLGMIVAFQDIATTNQPVTPALVADGLWQAMLTTAFGLIIALPALFAAQLYRIWADRHTALLEAALERLNLAWKAGRAQTQASRQ